MTRRSVAAGGSFPRRRRSPHHREQSETMTDRENPWSVPVVVAQIPESGLHRDIEASASERRMLAEVAGLRELTSADASLDLAPMRGGRVHVTGRVRGRVGQTCVVTLEPIE